MAHCGLYSVQSVTVGCTVTVHCTLYTVGCTITVHCTLYTVGCTIAVHCTVLYPHLPMGRWGYSTVQCTAIVHPTVYSVQCTVIVHPTVYSVQCTVTVHPTVTDCTEYNPQWAIQCTVDCGLQYGGTAYSGVQCTAYCGSYSAQWAVRGYYHCTGGCLRTPYCNCTSVRVGAVQCM